MNAHPHLANLIGAYLNQDYSYYGDTLEAVIDAFKADATAEQMRQVRSDIAAFRRDHPADLDATFTAAFGADFDPGLWGHTAESFLEMLDRRLTAGGL